MPNNQRNASWEQYNSSWRTLRHKELIREVGITSSLSYIITGVPSEASLARNLLLNYSLIYPQLEITDKLNRTVGIGGKLTSQSLDEAVFLIDLAWIYHMINPILNQSEKNTIEQDLLVNAVNVLQTEGNQIEGIYLIGLPITMLLLQW